MVLAQVNIRVKLKAVDRQMESSRGRKTRTALEYPRMTETKVLRNATYEGKAGPYSQSDTDVSLK
jgi:hypothetical protein